MTRIEKEAEEKYPLFEIDKQQASESKELVRMNGVQKNCRIGFIAGALSEQTRSKKVVEALREIAEGKGRYSTDRLQHAINTIEDMILIAKQALAEYDGE